MVNDIQKLNRSDKLDQLENLDDINCHFKYQVRKCRSLIESAKFILFLLTRLLNLVVGENISLDNKDKFFTGDLFLLNEYKKYTISWQSK